MSIIHDALKKSGQNVIADNSKAGPESKGGKSSIRPAVQVHRRRASANWGPLLVLALIVLVAGPTLMPLIYHPSRNTGETVSVGQEVSTRLSQFGVEEAALPQASKSFGFFNRNGAGAYTLSGIVFAGPDSYSLINGRILKQGESIGDAVVESISSDQVTLNRNGERIVLTSTNA